MMYEDYGGYDGYDLDGYGYDASRVRRSYQRIAIGELVKVLENNFADLGNLNILEVAAGEGHFTRELLKLFAHVTAIDPLLSMEEEHDKLTKEKKQFDCNTDCHGYNVLISYCPCEAAENVVDASIKYKKPFFMIMCNCLHGFTTKHERYEHLKSKAENLALYKNTKDIWFLTNLNI